MALVGNVHLVPGDASAIDAIVPLVRQEGIAIDANPDIYVRSYAHFGVEDARELRERADLGALGSRRVFIVQTPVITAEAQNALLKTFEDAPGEALFFLVVPNPGALLPTVRSRAHILDMHGAESVAPIDGALFLAASPSKRLDMLKMLLEKGDDERRDIAGIIAFLSALERRVGERGAGERAALHAIYRARKYLGDKGSLIKPLLEQVALLVPVVK